MAIDGLVLADLVPSVASVAVTVAEGGVSSLTENVLTPPIRAALRAAPRLHPTT